MKKYSQGQAPGKAVWYSKRNTDLRIKSLWASNSYVSKTKVNSDSYFIWPVNSIQHSPWLSSFWFTVFIYSLLGFFLFHWMLPSFSFAVSLLSPQPLMLACIHGLEVGPLLFSIYIPQWSHGFAYHLYGVHSQIYFSIMGFSLKWTYSTDHPTCPLRFLRDISEVTCTKPNFCFLLFPISIVTPPCQLHTPGNRNYLWHLFLSSFIFNIPQNLLALLSKHTKNSITLISFFANTLGQVTIIFHLDYSNSLLRWPPCSSFLPLKSVLHLRLWMLLVQYAIPCQASVQKPPIAFHQRVKTQILIIANTALYDLTLPPSLFWPHLLIFSPILTLLHPLWSPCCSLKFEGSHREPSHLTFLCLE